MGIQDQITESGVEASKPNYELKIKEWDNDKNEAKEK